jgi:hypothetical protein
VTVAVALARFVVCQTVLALEQMLDTGSQVGVVSKGHRSLTAGFRVRPGICRIHEAALARVMPVRRRRPVYLHDPDQINGLGT